MIKLIKSIIKFFREPYRVRCDSCNEEVTNPFDLAYSQGYGICKKCWKPKSQGGIL